MVSQQHIEVLANDWEVPAFKQQLLDEKRHNWAVVIPVINEGDRIKSLLSKMVSYRIYDIADLYIIDGGSTDDSLDLNYLKSMNVSGLLTKTGPGKLSAQLRCGYAFCLLQGYEGIITIDGNDKDDPVSIPQFINTLKEGVDFVQGSRFIEDGVGENTPRTRDFAIRYIHAPLLSFFSGFHWTDTTQGYRAYSSKLLTDKTVSPFRNIFSSYELLAYLSYRAPKLGFKCLEIPTIRRYPKGLVPTKIKSISGNLSLLLILLKACLGVYN